MSDPTTSNSAAGTVDTIIADVNTAGVQLVEKLAIADVPFLGFPIIKQIFQFALGWLDGYISKAIQLGATFGIIDIQVGAEKNALSQALLNVIAAEKTGDAAQIKAAIQAYANAQSALVNDDGSATPK